MVAPPVCRSKDPEAATSENRRWRYCAASMSAVIKKRWKAALRWVNSFLQFSCLLTGLVLELLVTLIAFCLT